MKSSSRTISATLSILIGVLALGHSDKSHAYSFVPEAQEWASWPAYCKARYVTTDIGKRTDFASEVDPAVVRFWQTTIGPDAFVHMHHYCAGVIWLERARRGW